MSATHAPETAGPVQSGARTNRGLVVLVTVLTVITLGLAGWLASLLLAEEETAPTPDVAAVVEDYRDAWNAHDGAAFLALVTPDFEFYDTPGLPGDSAGTTAAMIGADLAPIEWAVAEVGEPLIASSGSTVEVSMVNRVTSTSALAEGDGISLLTLVQVDGSWKVRQHIFIG